MNAIHELMQVDLNLLPAFIGLYEHRSVTAAAKAAGVTQSAMSHTLGRLRSLLGDPLFVRQGRQMVPTPRAEALAGPVRSRLQDLALALSEPDRFDPSTSQRRFSLGSVDLFDALVVPSLARSLAELAPGTRLAARPQDRHAAEQLDRGELDVAIHPVLEGMAGLPEGGLKRRTLIRDGFLVFARRGHPHLEHGCSSVERWAAASHLLVTPDGGPGLADRALAQLGLSRHVAVTLHQFSAALPVLQQTDLLLTAPAALARLAPPGAIETRACPLELPNHTVTLVWSERWHHDAGHRWFRELVASVTQSEASATG